MATELARWVGEMGCATGNGVVLVPGETVVEVPRAEAEASDLWEPLAEAPKDTKPVARLTAADNGEPEKN